MRYVIAIILIILVVVISVYLYRKDWKSPELPLSVYNNDPHAPGTVPNVLGVSSELQWMMI